MRAVYKAGINHEFSQPGVHQTNAIIERCNLDINCGIRTSLMRAGLPNCFWIYAGPCYCMHETRADVLANWLEQAMQQVDDDDDLIDRLDNQQDVEKYGEPAAAVEKYDPFQQKPAIEAIENQGTFLYRRVTTGECMVTLREADEHDWHKVKRRVMLIPMAESLRQNNVIPRFQLGFFVAKFLLTPSLHF